MNRYKEMLWSLLNPFRYKKIQDLILASKLDENSYYYQVYSSDKGVINFQHNNGSLVLIVDCSTELYDEQSILIAQEIVILLIDLGIENRQARVPHDFISYFADRTVDDFITSNNLKYLIMDKDSNYSLD